MCLPPPIPTRRRSPRRCRTIDCSPALASKWTRRSTRFGAFAARAVPRRGAWDGMSRTAAPRRAKTRCDSSSSWTPASMSPTCSRCLSPLSRFTMKRNARRLPRSTSSSLRDGRAWTRRNRDNALIKVWRGGGGDAVPPREVKPQENSHVLAMRRRYLNGIGIRRHLRMPDMLVHLLKLPPLEPLLAEMRQANVVIRRALPFESGPVRAFITKHFGAGWADEIAVGYANKPSSVYIALRDGHVVGFGA